MKIGDLCLPLHALMITLVKNFRIFLKHIYLILLAALNFTIIIIIIKVLNIVLYMKSFTHVHVLLYLKRLM